MKMPGGMTRRWLLLGVFAIGFVVLIANSAWWETALRFLFPDERPVLHPSNSLLAMVGEHMLLVGLSSALAVAIGVPLGMWVTRPSGRSFLPIVSVLASFGQTFPPIAVLVLAVPVMGFGLEPTVLALFLYGLLPVVRNTIVGLQTVPVDLVDAAHGMGMGRVTTLLRVEAPLALPVILAGIRISVIINIGTAMIGAIIGAGGLGSPVISGMLLDNTAYVLEGAVPAAMLAVLVDQLLANVEKSFAYPV